VTAESLASVAVFWLHVAPPHVSKLQQLLFPLFSLTHTDADRKRIECHNLMCLVLKTTKGKACAKLNQTNEIYARGVEERIYAELSADK